MASIIGVENLQHPSGTTAATIDSSGRILTPARPAFHVRYSAANSAGVQGDIVFNEVDFNTGGHYSTSNGRFTAPISGLYWFSFQSLTAGTTGGGTVPANTAASVRFDKNGSGGSWSPKAYVYDASSADYSYINLTHIIELSANDYIQVNFTELYSYTDGSGNFDPTFQGYLIG